MIAKKDDDTSWVSKKEWDSYSLAVRTAGNLIIGHRTYNIITKQPEFSEFKDVKITVVSQRNFSTLSPNHLVAHSPKEALGLLKDFKEIIVAGGGILNSSFLAKNLIDEIYLDVEPLVFGDGIPLFATAGPPAGKAGFEYKLKLLGVKKLGDQTIQLHYKVQK